MSTPLRLAACATHPIQYQAPIWRRLAASSQLDFQAFFGSDMSVRGYTDREFGTTVAWDTPLVSGYQHTFLSNDPRIQQINFWRPAATDLARKFRDFRPEVVLLTAYAGRFHLEALWAAKRVGAKVLMRHEASDVAVTRSRRKGWVRDAMLRQLYAQVDGFAVIGREARRHLLRLGVPDKKMVAAPYCVDTDYFSGEVTRWSPQREKIRAEMGMAPEAVVLVFSGKLIPKKDPLLIAAALRLLEPAFREGIHLIVAGDGEMRGEMELAVGGAIGARAHFLGFLNQSEIGRAYTAGDLLMLPSRVGAGETWGLVVNEAMQFGLGVLASDGVGCGPDLISELTGQIFRSGDATTAAAALRSAVTAIRANRSQFAVAARRRVADFTAAQAADGVAKLAWKVTRDPLS